jgi:hypothetical protein
MFTWIWPFTKKSEPESLEPALELERNIKTLILDLINLKQQVQCNGLAHDQYYYRLESYRNGHDCTRKGWSTLFEKSFDITERQRDPHGELARDLVLNKPLEQSFLNHNWSRAFYCYKDSHIANLQRESRQPNLKIMNGIVYVQKSPISMNNCIMTRFKKDTKALVNQTLHQDASCPHSSYIIPNKELYKIPWDDMEFNIGNFWLPFNDEARALMNEVTNRFIRAPLEFDFFLRYVQGILTQEMENQLVAT